jgi:hypothetical protein
MKLTGLRFPLTFEYADTNHPFAVCGNSTALPTYYIDLNLYLTPTGYNLSKTVWSTRYYSAQNSTIDCTTVTSS